MTPSFPPALAEPAFLGASALTGLGAAVAGARARRRRPVERAPRDTRAQVAGRRVARAMAAQRCVTALALQRSRRRLSVGAAKRH